MDIIAYFAAQSYNALKCDLLDRGYNVCVIVDALLKQSKCDNLDETARLECENVGSWM